MFYSGKGSVFIYADNIIICRFQQVEVDKSNLLIFQRMKRSGLEM